MPHLDPMSPGGSGPGQKFGLSFSRCQAEGGQDTSLQQRSAYGSLSRPRGPLLEAVSLFPMNGILAGGFLPICDEL